MASELAKTCAASFGAPPKTDFTSAAYSFVDTIAALAEAVDADCCYQNGVYKCSSDSQVPESCSYTCGVVMVPFMNGCRDLITNLFPRELTGLTTLYEQCLNADARVLANAYNHRECCTCNVPKLPDLTWTNRNFVSICVNSVRI